MQPLVVAQMLVLIGLANGAPIFAKKLLNGRFPQPLDGGAPFFDGRPVFGSSKTLRGIVVSLLATTAAAPLIGVGVDIGAIAAGTAMAGDLASSFVKRRLGLAPSSRAMGLDQIPESVFPLLACRDALSLSFADAAVTAGLFFVVEHVLSRLLYMAHVRDQPY